jgi:hypothetical protein
MSEPRRHDADPRPPYRNLPRSYPGTRARDSDAPGPTRGRPPTGGGPTGGSQTGRQQTGGSQTGRQQTGGSQTGRQQTGRQSVPGRAPQLWGTLPGRTGICIVVAGAALGAVITVVTGREPGLVLGILLVAGTITGALAVRPRAVYRIIPAPALAYVAAAAVAGLIHDRATDSSLTGLAVSAAQWIASGFIAMTVATLAAVAITAVRWPRRHSLRAPDPPRPVQVRQPEAQDSADPARPPADWWR